MPNFSSVTVLGRVSRDIELKHIGSAKTPLCEVSLAINHTTKNQDGSKKETTTWVEVTCWNRLAEIASQYLRKGDPAFFHGRLQTDQWTDKEGLTKSKLKIIAEQMQLLTGKPERKTPAAVGPILPYEQDVAF